MRVEQPGWVDTCNVPVQQPEFLSEKKKQATCSRVHEPFTTGYYVTGMHTRKKVLMLRLQIFTEDIPRVPEAEYR